MADISNYSSADWAKFFAQKQAQDDAERKAAQGVQNGFNPYENDNGFSDTLFRNGLSGYNFDGLPQGLSGRHDTNRFYQAQETDRPGYAKNIVYDQDANGNVVPRTEYAYQGMTPDEGLVLAVLAGMGGAAAGAYGGGAVGAAEGGTGAIASEAGAGLGASAGAEGGGLLGAVPEAAGGFTVAPAMTNAELAALAQGGSDVALSGASADLAAAGYGAGGAGGLGGLSASSGSTAGTTGAAGTDAGLTAAEQSALAAGTSAPASSGGLLSKAGELAASPLGKAAVAGVGGLLGGAGGSGPSSQTATTQNAVDPRMGNILYGANGSSGLLNQIAGQANVPQNAGSASFGNAMDDYLGQYGRGQYDTNMRAAQMLTGSNFNAPTMNAAQINTPSQNGIDLSSAYNKMINGNAAENPYLTGAIQKGINQSNNAFGNYLSDASKSTQSLLGDIRGGAIVNGQMGGTRQGIAEGKALDSFNTNIGRAISQYGQNNTDAAISAQAGAFDQGQNRSLSALSGLSGNQYNAANANAGYQQGANANNQQSTLSTNQLNSANKLNGLNASNTMLGQGYNYANNQNNYNLNRLSGVSGALQPFSGLGSSQTNSQPLYNNTTGNVIAGATAGLGLLNAYKNSGGFDSGFSSGWF